MNFKNIFYNFIFVLIVCSGCSNQIEQPEQNLKSEEPSNEAIIEKFSTNEKKYFGKWTIDSCFGVGVPSIWGEEAETLIGKKLELREDFIMFNDAKLSKPLYKEEILSPEEIDLEYLTTYETLGLPPNSVRVNIYHGDNKNKSLIDDCVIYEFFIKDDDTLIAANRNMYFALSRQ